MNSIKSILFVCTGNSCRSVMAEGMLKKRLKELGKDGIIVRSAGVRAIDGCSPTNETINVMKLQGVDISAFKSTGITDELIKGSDLILVLERAHKIEITRNIPAVASKTFFLREYGRSDKPKELIDPDISDPIGLPVSGYNVCLEMIKEDIERVAKLL